jgi:hypothetical protein
MSRRLFDTRAHHWRVRFFAVLVGTFGLLAGSVGTRAPHFYPDDPIAREPEAQDASKAQPVEMGSLYELSYNLFVTAGYKPSGLRAKNINTIDEVPDSSWFTNRIGTTTVPTADLVRGPNFGEPPDPSKWVLTREKTSGSHPGFTARDAKGETWFLEFDPTHFAEGATGAVQIATKFFWALGYNQVESYLTSFDPRKVEIDPKATLRRPSRKRTPFTRDDMNEILERVAKNADGTYRIIAGRLIRGKILGGYQYAGTRSDDPNDLIPHEHHRELRALRVFGAWTNLTDLKAMNTVDSLVTENGRSIVKHYLQDVGSTFGLCNDYYEWDLSWEYFYQGGPTVRRLLSFGFALSPWQTVDYVEYPSIGKFEGDVFDPRKWRPQTPTTAYMELRDDDAFWAARRVAAFTDDMIRTIVHTGQFSNPAAEKELGDVLIKRRDKITSIYLTAVNPVVSPSLGANNQLTFENAAVAAGVAKGSATYRASWFLFDNATGERRPLSETRSSTTTIEAPSGVPTAAGSFVAVDIAVDSDGYPTWKQPVRTTFRREGQGWKLVGLERLPDKPQPTPGQKPGNASGAQD